jgi:multicomponent Na+:H+ antiporter subunit D
MIPLLSFFAIPSYMATAFVITLVSLKKDEYVPYVAVTGAFMAMVFSFLAIPSVIDGSPVAMQMEEWVAPYGITIYGDFLSVGLSCLVSFMGVLIFAFSYRYVQERRTKYFALLSLLFAGLIGVIHTGDMFNLFVFTEIMSIASYGLVAFKKDGPSLEASIKYLIMGSIGTSLMLIGIAFLYGLTGSLNMADISLAVSGMSNPALAVSFGFLLAGLLVKAGLVPFHAWLIDAHPAAPSPVSAVLSGLMINVGFYAIMRVGLVVYSNPQALSSILLVAGPLSMVIGSVAALRQPNLKRMLAYSSISQMGYIAMALGLGTSLGLVGAMFHVINQVVIKGLLFLCSGALIYTAGSADFSELSGRIVPGKALSWSFLIGVLGLAGVPLFSGFSSKLVIYAATLDVSPVLTVLSVLVSAITLAYGLKAYSLIFGSNPSSGVRAKPLPRTMTIPLLILAAIIIILGVLPWIGLDISSMMAAGLDRALYIQGVHI